MKVKNIILISVLTFIFVIRIAAQGCSDAGFCTVNSFKPDADSNEKVELNNQIKAGFSYGKSDHSISVLTAYLDYHRTISEKISFDARISGIRQMGNEYSNLGLSDIFLNGNFRLLAGHTMTLGVKIPISLSNKMKNGLSLPMYFQSGLGTLDIFGGYSISIKKFLFVVAFQHPLTQNNNEFFAENQTSSYLKSFQSTNKFIRKGDILFRASYPFNIAGRFTVTPAILPIYHLDNDAYTNEIGIEKIIEGSKGLTLNTNLFIDYRISQSNSIQLSTGFPLITRDSRPEGLTRSFVASIEYKFSF